MDKYLKEQFNKVKEQKGRLKADPIWVAENKARLMSQINNTTVDSAKKEKTYSFLYIWQVFNVFLPSRVVYSVLRPVVAMVLVIVVATSGWIAGVSATANSLPGDVGYGVKLAVEKTQIIVSSVTASDDEEVKMHLELASRRAKEIKEVVKSKDGDVGEKVELTVKRMTDSMEDAEKKAQTVGEKTPDKILDTGKEVSQKSREITKDLKEAEKMNDSVDLADAKKKISESGLEAVRKVVEKKEEGVMQASDEDIKKLVTDQITGVLEDIDEVKHEVDNVNKQIVDTAKAVDDDAKVDAEQKATDAVEKENLESNDTSTDYVEGNESEIVSSTTSSSEGLKNNTSSTKEINTTTVDINLPADIKTVKETVEDMVKRVSVNDKNVKKNIEEAQFLVENNLLSEAIEKVRQVANTTQQTDK